MVQLTSTRYGVMKTFGHYMKKNANPNHRVPLKYQRFQDEIEKEDIVAHYSRDDIDKIDPREGERTLKDAQQTMGRKNLLLPNLGEKDLELNHIYQTELDRQRAAIARISKIRVMIDSNPGKDLELIMNRDISTPFDCARHIHDLVASRSVVAQVSPIEQSQGSDLSGTPGDQNSNNLTTSQESQSEENKLVEHQHKQRPIFWDMYRPLQDSCRLRFRHFTEKDVAEVNKIYWRSCSFVLGMAVRMAFKDGVKVLLHSWPKPDVRSGSFVYDLALNLSEVWRPSEQELRAFTKVMWNIKGLELPFERLQVDREVALQLFSGNPFKLAQIDSILENQSSQGKITVYRCGGLLDISIGPMIANTNQIGRISLASVHPIELPTTKEAYKGIFYRFQGISIPQELPLSSYLYQNVLLNQAKKLNKIAL